MKRLQRAVAVAFVGIVAASGVFLSAKAYAQDAANFPQPVATPYVPLDMVALEQLAAPVALYPDAILAQVLVACTYPDDVIAAAQWLAAGNDPQGIDNQPWDLSVRGVARYPDVLNYLASNPDFMNELGAAYINQGADVMAAVQALRAEAMAAGNLGSCDQEQVLCDGDIIEIFPTDPDFIYLPIYDWNDIYLWHGHLPGQRFEPLIHWGRGIRVGAWLHHDIDWHDHAVYVGNWGGNRPWWNHGSGQNNYLQTRPGTINYGQAGAEGGRWTRDAHKPMPKPALRTNNVRPNSGYATPLRGNETTTIYVPSGYGRGTTVNQASARGRESINDAGLNSAHSAPPTHAPAPPPPSARPSAPTQGGASGGYTSGEDASRSSSRGASSRGEPSSAGASSGGRR